MTGEHEFTCEELHTCDESVDDLWARARESDSVMVPRTAEFFNWRYFQKPGREYTVYGIKDRNGVLQGLLVLKVFIGRDETAGHVIDFLAADNPEIQQAILNKPIEFFTEKEVTNITCWITRHNPIAAQLQAIGFSQTEWPTYSGVRILDDAFADASFVSDSNRWSFTMGDSVVF